MPCIACKGPCLCCAAEAMTDFCQNIRADCYLSRQKHLTGIQRIRVSPGAPKSVYGYAQDIQDMEFHAAQQEESQQG